MHEKVNSYNVPPAIDIPLAYIPGLIGALLFFVSVLYLVKGWNVYKKNRNTLNKGHIIDIALYLSFAGLCYCITGGVIEEGSFSRVLLIPVFLGIWVILLPLNIFMKCKAIKEQEDTDT